MVVAVAAIGGSGERLARDRQRIAAAGLCEGAPGRVAAEAHEVARQLVLPVLVAHLAVELAVAIAGDRAERLRDIGQRARGRLLEIAGERATDGRLRRLSEKAAGFLEQIAEKAVDLILVADLEQLGGELHLVLLVDDLALASAVAG